MTTRPIRFCAGVDPDHRDERHDPDLDRRVRRRMDRSMVDRDELRNATNERTDDPPIIVFAGECDGEHDDDVGAWLARRWGAKVRKEVTRGTHLLVVRKLASDDGAKLDKAREFGVPIVDEKFLRWRLCSTGGNDGWREAVAMAHDYESVHSRARFGTVHGDAHTETPAVLLSGCTQQATLAYCEALLCLGAVPGTDLAAAAAAARTTGAKRVARAGGPYQPRPDEEIRWTDGFHAWKEPGIVRWYRHPTFEDATRALHRYIDAYDRVKKKGPLPQRLPDSVLHATRSHSAPGLNGRRNNEALDVANTQAGLLGELMRRLRRCDAGVDSYTLDTGCIAWIVSIALRLRRTAASAHEALEHMARNALESAWRVCEHHDFAEQRIERSFPFSDGIPYRLPRCYCAYFDCFSLTHAFNTGTLAAAPLALADLLLSQTCCLPVEWSGLTDLVRFLVVDLVEAPATAATGGVLGAMPHIATLLDGVFGGAPCCDAVLATAAAFGCPAATRALGKKVGALGSVEWGACLPDWRGGFGVVPQTAAEARRTAADDAVALTPTPRVLPGGPVGVLAMVLCHLHRLARPAAMADVSPLANAIALAGTLAPDPDSAGARVSVTIASRLAQSDDGWCERVWRGVYALAKADARCPNPKPANCKPSTREYTVRMCLVEWETLRSEVDAATRHGIGGLPQRLVAHRSLIVRLQRLAWTWAELRHEKVQWLLTWTLGYPRAWTTIEARCTQLEEKTPAWRASTSKVRTLMREVRERANATAHSYGPHDHD